MTSIQNSSSEASDETSAGTRTKHGAQRSNQKPSRDPALDGLRGIAVLMVFVFHYGGGLQSQYPFVRVLGYLTQTGWIGVILFFALSGFLITGILWDSLEQKHLWLNFYGRRVLRIFPLYFFILLAALVYGLEQGYPLKELKALWIYVLFLQNFPGLRQTALNMRQTLPLYHLWSIAVEEQFYLIWPAILIFAENRRAARKHAIWAVEISVVFCICIWMVPTFAAFRYRGSFNEFLVPYASVLALGGALALALRSRNKAGRVGKPRRIVQKWAPHAFWSGITVYLIVSWYARSLLLVNPMQYVVGLPAIGLSCVALISIVLRYGLTRSLLSLTPLVWLGRISYGFYVYHIALQPLFDFLATKLSHDWHGNVYQADRLLIAFPITLIVSSFSFYLLERPFLKLKRFFPMHKSDPTG